MTAITEHGRERTGARMRSGDFPTSRRRLDPRDPREAAALTRRYAALFEAVVTQAREDGKLEMLKRNWRGLLRRFGLLVDRPIVIDGLPGTTENADLREYDRFVRQTMDKILDEIEE